MIRVATELRGQIARAASSSGLLTSLNRIIWNRRHVIFTFHRVRPAGTPTDPFDTCPSIPVDLFEKLVAYAVERFTILPLDELCKNTHLKKPLAAITFDDGWIDNRDIAHPILKQQGIPATIFVTTGKLGEVVPFWQQRLGKYFRQIAAEADPTEGLKLRQLIGIQGDSRSLETLFRLTVRAWKERPLSEIEQRLAILEQRWKSEWHRPCFISKADLREMSKNNIQFGSHTVNHRILTVEGEAIVRNELLVSKMALEGSLGNQIEMFAYPDGATSPKIQAIAYDIGYRIGVTTHSSAFGHPPCLLTLPRIDADWQMLTDKAGKLVDSMIDWVVWSNF